MAKAVSENIEMLMRVVDRLAPLLERFVFLGGAVTELLVTSPSLASPRQTKDIAGRWQKVIKPGSIGEVHYLEHASGAVAGVKFFPWEAGAGS